MNRMEAAEVAGGLAVAGRQLRRVLRTRALRPRRLPRTASPPPAAASPRRNAHPMTATAGTATPSDVSRQACRSPDERSPGIRPERRALSGPALHPQGHPKILSNRSDESIFGTHPCARSLYRPSGPDGEGQAKGQARNARGEPPRTLIRHLSETRRD